MTAQPAWTPEGTFPERLALIRVHHGWNVKEAALACGIARATWASWEAGKSPHNYVEVCRKIADAAGVDPLWLISGSLPSGSPGASASSRCTPPSRPLPNLSPFLAAA